MVSFLESLEKIRTSIPKKARLSLIALLIILGIVLPLVAGGPTMPLIAWGLIACAILLIATHPKRAIYGLLVVAISYIALSLRVYGPYDDVFGGEWVQFGGNDPWYHMRLVENLVQHFPHRIAFDPFTLFPSGQTIPFAPFFDLLLGFFIWVVALGSPTQHTIETVGAYFPAILGALVTIPVYFIGKELFNRTVGLLSAALIAILPGEYLFRSLLGFTDHHIAEVLFSTTAALFLILAIKRARENEISFSHIRSRNWGNLKKPLIYAVLAGLALGIYLDTWSGGLLFVFIVFAYIVIQYIVNHLRGKSTDYLCIIGVPMFFIALIVVIPFLDSLVHGDLIVTSLVIGMFTPIALSAVSRLMANRDVKQLYYPLTLAVLGIVGIALLYVIDPSLYHAMVSKFTRVFTPSEASQTIMEARPFFSGFDISSLTEHRAWSYFTTGFFIVPIALLLLMYTTFKEKSSGKILLFTWGAVILLTILVSVTADLPEWIRYIYYAMYGSLFVVYFYFEKSAEKILLVLWSLIMLMAMLGQVRFAYYFAVNVALLMGYFCWRIPGWISSILDWIGFREPSLDDKKRKKGRASKQEEPTRFIYLRPKHASAALSVIIVFFLTFYPFLFFPTNRQVDNPEQACFDVNPFFSYQCSATGYTATHPWGPNDAWHSSLVWMGDIENTPDPFEDPDVYYELYDRPPAGERYDYPESAYGVMSWWDYGHWITRIAHRIPNANPFQSGAVQAAKYLTAQDESSANEMLDDLGSGYVVIDFEMAITKFHVMPTWAGGNTSDFYEMHYQTAPEGTQQYQALYYPEYYQSMNSRLYNFGGEAVVPHNSTWAISHTEVVGEGGNKYKLITDVANQGLPFPTYEEAQVFIDDHPDYIIVGVHPFISAVPLEKLEHYELVHKSVPPISWGDKTISYVKIFKYMP
jgi:oligosaccharyl transferase (archaeosortase A-associated)